MPDECSLGEEVGFRSRASRSSIITFTCPERVVGNPSFIPITEELSVTRAE